VIDVVQVAEPDGAWQSLLAPARRDGVPRPRPSRGQALRGGRGVRNKANLLAVWRPGTAHPNVWSGAGDAKQSQFAGSEMGANCFLYQELGCGGRLVALRKQSQSVCRAGRERGPRHGVAEDPLCQTKPICVAWFNLARPVATLPEAWDGWHGQTCLPVGPRMDRAHRITAVKEILRLCSGRGLAVPPAKSVPRL
jgi:hypothetical protein